MIDKEVFSMNKEAIIKKAFVLRRKLVVLEYAEAIGNAAEAYRFFEVPKSTFYVWKKAYALEGRADLVQAARADSFSQTGMSSVHAEPTNEAGRARVDLIPAAVGSNQATICWPRPAAQRRDTAVVHTWHEGS